MLTFANTFSRNLARSTSILATTALPAGVRLSTFARRSVGSSLRTTSPAALSWSHEHAEMPPHAHGRYFDVAAFKRVPEIIERLAKS